MPLWEHSNDTRGCSARSFPLIAPQPARAQFGFDWGAIVAAINSIGKRNLQHDRFGATNNQWRVGDFERPDERHTIVFYQYRVPSGGNKPELRDWSGQFKASTRRFERSLT